MLKRASLKDNPRRLRLPAQANPSDRVDLPDRHAYILGYYIMLFFVTYYIRRMKLMPVTVHLDLALVAHCSALTGMKWSVLGRLRKIMHLHCCRLLIVVAIFLSHVLTCIRISHYTLLPIMEVSPRPEASWMAPCPTSSTALTTHRTADDTLSYILAAARETP